MCGILCGQSQDPRTLEKVDAGLRAIAHRGPDGAAVLMRGQVFLAHTRLAIVGVEHGTQPLCNESGTVFASVNGEFYGHRAIRQKLQAMGHVFKTESDSEVLIHLYEEYGVECLEHLHGEFAFALYDTQLERWFCARDRVGIRPLQYVHDETQFIIASEAKALFAVGVPAKLSRSNYWFSQHLQYLPRAGTLFEGVHMVPPASYLLVDKTGARVRRYWNINDVREQSMTFDEAKEHSGLLLRQAIRRRTPDEVKWACHLSGGIDSSIVSAVSQSQPGAGHCFTVRFTDDGFYDESPFARVTADHIGAELHDVPVSFGDMLDAMPKAIYHAEGLSINGHLGAKYLLNKAMRDAGFKVALTGEGADEIFMGYSHLKVDHFSNLALSQMERTYLSGVQLPSGSTLDLSEVHRRLGFIPTWLAAKSSMAAKLQPMWHSNFQDATNPYVQLLDESGIALAPVSNLKKSSSLWTQYCLSGYILKVLDDAQAMAHGIEGRLPFLDTKLMEFMWSVPDDLYFHEGVEKGLLRKGFASELPASGVNRIKQSFMSPPTHWAMKQPHYKARIEEIVLDSQHFAGQNLFSRAALESFLKQCETNDAPSNEPILMTLMSTALLCEEFSL